MDVLTHLFLPYAAALAAYGLHRAPPAGAPRRPRLSVDPRPAAGAALVFGLASAAPDLDSAYSWVKTFSGMWWLQHRGISHTLIGAPLHGLLVVGLLHLVGRRWPDRFGVLRFRPLYVPLAVIGSWAHLAIDGMTYAGTPALFPWTSRRYTLPLFHWLVDWMFVFWAAVVALKLWRRLGPHFTVRAGAVALVLLVVLGGIRLGAMPEVGEDEILLPRSSPFEWTVLRPHDNGSWEAFLVRGDDERGRLWYMDRGPRDAGAEDAIARARDTDAYRGFEMGLFGPVVVNVTRDDVPEEEAGGTPVEPETRVTFTAVAQHFEVQNGLAWTPSEPKDTWGVLRLIVRPAGVEVVQLGW